MSDVKFSVPGMTCGHCVQAVTTELQRVPGVTGVVVDLDTKAVVVTGSPLDTARLAEAVDEAGFEAVGLA